MRTAFVILALIATSAAAAPPSTCALEGEYERALCAYQHREFGAAESGFRAIVDRGAADEQTMHSIYFLARTLMKSGRYDEASALLIRIYSLDQSFYETWNGDFLLGECRRALGK
ncbi:MAG TPA: hypothetical protein VF824_07405 [Thermoanaerobaculia bacterium]